MRDIEQDRKQLESLVAAANRMGLREIKVCSMLGDYINEVERLRAVVERLTKLCDKCEGCKLAGCCCACHE